MFNIKDNKLNTFKNYLEIIQNLFVNKNRYLWHGLIPQCFGQTANI